MDVIEMFFINGTGTTGIFTFSRHGRPPVLIGARTLGGWEPPKAPVLPTAGVDPHDASVRAVVLRERRVALRQVLVRHGARHGGVPPAAPAARMDAVVVAHWPLAAAAHLVALAQLDAGAEVPVQAQGLLLFITVVRAMMRIPPPRAAGVRFLVL